MKHIWMTEEGFYNVLASSDAAISALNQSVITDKPLDMNAYRNILRIIVSAKIACEEAKKKEELK